MAEGLSRFLVGVQLNGNQKERSFSEISVGSSEA